MSNKMKFSEKDFSMPAWLYQMSSGGSGGLWRSSQNQPWCPSSYRQDVVEGYPPIRWDVGKIYSHTKVSVAKGDTVVFFFCKTGKKDPNTGDFKPGIYGWGKIINPPQDSYDQIEFIVEPPSDYLKAKVLWDSEIEQVTNAIRGRQYQGTMWPISKSQLQTLRRKIAKYIQSNSRT